MSAQPAYSLYPQRVPESRPRTRISVVPGQRSRTTSAPASAITPALVLKVVAVALIVLTCAAFARLGPCRRYGDYVHAIPGALQPNRRRPRHGFVA